MVVGQDLVFHESSQCTTTSIGTIRSTADVCQNGYRKKDEE